MTIGIYALYWEEQDLIYIGLSQNIEGRFIDHKRYAKANRHTNYKVQDTFNKYGTPELKILEKCSIAELNDKEVYWTKEFNSINNGLNIIEAGQVGFGPNSNNSKYSKRQILKVFSMLYRTDKSYKYISQKTNTSATLVSDIAQSRTHLWLKECYPIEFKQIQSNAVFRQKKAKFISRHTEEVVLISPETLEYTIFNIKEFCIEILLKDSNTTLKHVIKGVSRLINGNCKVYKGWKLKQCTVGMRG